MLTVWQIQILSCRERKHKPCESCLSYKMARHSLGSFTTLIFQKYSLTLFIENLQNLVHVPLKILRNPKIFLDPTL